MAGYALIVGRGPGGRMGPRRWTACHLGGGGELFPAVFSPGALEGARIAIAGSHDAGYTGGGYPPMAFPRLFGDLLAMFGRGRRAFLARFHRAAATIDCRADALAQRASLHVSSWTTGAYRRRTNEGPLIKIRRTSTRAIRGFPVRAIYEASGSSKPGWSAWSSGVGASSADESF